MSKKSELYFYSGKTYIIPYGTPFRLMLYSQSLGQLHYHDFYELVIVLDGNAVHRTEEQDYPISTGDVFIIKKGKIHMYRYAETQTCQYHVRFRNSGYQLGETA